MRADKLIATGLAALCLTAAYAASEYETRGIRAIGVKTTQVVIQPTEDYINQHGDRCLVWSMPKEVYYYQCDDGEQGIYQVVEPAVPFRVMIPGRSQSTIDEDKGLAMN